MFQYGSDGTAFETETLEIEYWEGHPALIRCAEMVTGYCALKKSLYCFSDLVDQMKVFSQFHSHESHQRLITSFTSKFYSSNILIPKFLTNLTVLKLSFNLVPF